MATFLLRRSLAARPNIVTRSAVVKSTSRNTGTSALYGISALSDRHETQHFHKLSRLPLMEHSPTLKLIHTSEVAPGASSAPLSSLPDKSTAQEAQIQTKEPGLIEDKHEQDSKYIGDEEAASAGRAILSDYMEKIRGLGKQLHEQKAKVAELEQIVEKRNEKLQRVGKMWKEHNSSRWGCHPETGRPLSKKEYHERAANRSNDSTASSLVGLLFAALASFVGYHLGRNETASISGSEFDRSSAWEEVKSRSKVNRIMDGSVHGSDGSEDSDRSWTSLLWKKQ